MQCHPMQRFFQYDGPNHAASATEIFLEDSKEDNVYAHGEYKIFSPNTNTPEGCIQEWRENKHLWRDIGMISRCEDLIIFDAFFSNPKFLIKSN